MKAVPVYKAILQITGCCFFIAFILTVPAMAQTRGKVEVVKDARIDTFASRRADLNKANSEISVNGYRVQIFTGENRKEAYNAQTKFLEQFPNIHTYVIYSEPNFKVRAGDFRTRLEAEKLEEDLKKLFDGMFIITEKINPPKLDSTDE
jgi:SPOR domain